MSDFGADPNPDVNKIRLVAFGYNFTPGLDLKVDQFSTTGTDKVYHLVKRFGSTNVYFLVDPDNVPA